MKLKKFNEMFDPMGSWDPKQLDNKSTERTEDNPVIDEELPIKAIKGKINTDPEYIRKLPNNPEELTSVLDAGLDPTFAQNILLRVCFRDNLKDSFNILIDRIKEFNYGNYNNAKSHILKQATEYGRIEFLKKFYELGYFNDFNDSDWDDLLTWLRISRQMKNSDDKKKTEQFLLDLKNKIN